MSGHSHFATIKHKKAVTDAKRSKVFSKIARAISISAREKGGDPETNTNLRMMMDKAKEMNMPKDNVERAIKKGTGELLGEALENIIVEAFGPSGIAVIIEGITDNKNRSLGEIKQILSNNNGKLAGEGSVKWLFERKGIISIGSPESQEKKEKLEMVAIESGAEDMEWGDGLLTVYTKPEDLDKTKKEMESKGVTVNDSLLGWKEKESVSLSEEENKKCEKLFDSLDENDAVQAIYSNIKQHDNIRD